MLIYNIVSFLSLFLSREIYSLNLQEHSVVVLNVLNFADKEKSGSSFVDYYDFKVERNEPTCRLVNHPNLPKDRITLLGRDCMCDEDCVQYKDCCKDSRFYSAAEQSVESDYYCMETESTYVKTKCASGWSDKEVQDLCNKSIQPFDSDDISLKISISNTKTRTTYGNKYCAICNYDQDMNSWSAWNLGIRCGKPPRGYLKYKTIYADEQAENINANKYRDPCRECQNSQYQQSKVINNYIYGNSPGFILDINLYVYNDSESSYLNSNSVQLPVHIETNSRKLSLVRRKRNDEPLIDFETYADVAIEIAQKAIFDPNNKKFVSRYNNEDFVCEFQPFLPNNSEEFTRRCVPNMVRSCPKSFKDETIIKECSIRTSVAHQIDSGVSYRNRDCARCNGEKDKKLKGGSKTRHGLSEPLNGDKSMGLDMEVKNSMKFVPSKS